MQTGCITFNGEGPLMSGTWYNPSNGDSFTVADSFFQDNQYMIKTTDGRMLDYNFIQHYIKDNYIKDKPVEIPKKEKNQIQQLPNEVQSIIASDILPEDQQLIMGTSKPMGNLYSTAETQDVTNSRIINKALDKKNPPKFITVITWEDFPKKELDMLMDVLDINKDEILDWYISKIDMTAVKLSIKESLIEWINNKLDGVESDPELISESLSEKDPIDINIKPSKSTKISKKKSNKAR